MLSIIGYIYLVLLIILIIGAMFCTKDNIKTFERDMDEHKPNFKDYKTYILFMTIISIFIYLLPIMVPMWIVVKISNFIRHIFGIETIDTIEI